MLMVLGNLTVRQFAERVGAEFTDEEVERLELYRTNTAEFSDTAKFHIFDSPAINVYVGEVALKEAVPIFVAANERKKFNREVSFYPASTDKKEG